MSKLSIRLFAYRPRKKKNELRSVKHTDNERLSNETGVDSLLDYSDVGPYSDKVVGNFKSMYMPYFIQTHHFFLATMVNVLSLFT